jgi:hypothetical protein
MSSGAVVVTGVSSGIGRAVAEDLVGRGFRVFGSVRRDADAEALRNALGAGFEALRFDVTDEAAVRREAARVRELLGGEPLAGVVNNAGMTSGGPLMHQPAAEILETFRVNALSAVVVSQAFLPLLGARRGFTGRPGRIVNISSVGGRIVAPFAAAYQGAKHALEAYSDALRRELLVYGIDVVVIQPGSTRTTIWDKTRDIDMAPYRDTDFAEPLERFLRYSLDLGSRGYPPERVARVVHTALTARAPRARYAVVPGRLLNWDLPRALPDRWLDRVMARAFGLRRLAGRGADA